MKIIFLGTSSFAIPALTSIHKAFSVDTVITQVDKPRNRGKVSFCEVKEVAIKLGIKVLQYEKLKDHVEEIKAMKPDVMITASYGQILSKEFLDICKVINIHASLLPKYRGSAPIQWAIINGEKKTGVTTMLTRFRLDSGPILEQAELDIEDSDNAETLTNKLADLGSQLIIKTLQKFQSNKLNPKEQDENKATKCKMLKKEDGLIDWDKSCKEVFNFIRGMYVWPSAYSYLDGKYIKIFKTHLEDNVIDVHNKNADFLEQISNGSVFYKKNQILVKCKDGYISIDELQEEGKKRMPASSFICGHALKPNLKFCAKTHKD